MSFYLFTFFFYTAVSKKSEMTEFYWEATDFILQAEYMNLKKHKFLTEICKWVLPI